MRFWNAIVIWFQGKKTILGGALIVAGAVAGVWYGKLDAPSGLALAGVGLSVVGLGAKADRHQGELLTALQGVAKVGLDVRGGNTAVGIQDLKAMGAELLPGVAASVISAGGASLNLSAPNTAELLDAVTKLTAQPPPVTSVHVNSPFVGSAAK